VRHWPRPKCAVSRGLPGRAVVSRRPTHAGRGAGGAHIIFPPEDAPFERQVDELGIGLMSRAIAALFAAISVLLAASSPGLARGSGTCPHPGTINGASVLIACGHAKAKLHFGSTRLALRNGQCVKTSSNFGLDFGAALDGPTSKPPPDSFQLIAGPHGGSATLQIARSGKQYIGDSMKLKLPPNRSSGTLFGTVTLAAGTTKVAVSGSFTC
jgi:hypothetical protein